MATELTLDSPVTINPTQVSKVHVRTALIDFDADVVICRIDFVDVNGVVLDSKNMRGSSAAISTWIAARRAQIGNFVLNHLGVTGTVQ